MKSIFTERYITLSTVEAELQGYIPLTTPYSPNEKALLDKAISDMKGVDYALVRVRLNWLEIWRKKNDMKLGG